MASRAQRQRRIEREFADKLADGRIIRDDKAAIGIHAEIGGDEDRMHKRLHILDGGTPTEISKLSPLIKALEPSRSAASSSPTRPTATWRAVEGGPDDR